MKNKVLSLISRAPRAIMARALSILRRPRADGHVLMLHNGRSGSTLLGDMMDQHPGIFWDGEVIEKLLHNTSRSEGVGIDHLQGKFSLSDISRKIEKRINSTSGGKIYGIELQDYHLIFIGCQVHEFIEEFRKFGFSKFIYLDRNPIRKLTSHLVATKRDEWHIGPNGKTSGSTININPDRIYIGHRFSNLSDALDEMIRFKDESMQCLSKDDLLILDYEADLRSDPAVASAKICDHLGIAQHNPKVKFAKTADLKLSALIENFSEVETVLRASGHLAEGGSLDEH